MELQTYKEKKTNQQANKYLTRHKNRHLHEQNNINQNNLGHLLDRYPLGQDTHVHRSKSFLKIEKKQ